VKVGGYPAVEGRWDVLRERGCEPNDVLVYAKQKCSMRPGPRARQVDAAEVGDSYSYVVRKFWRVVARREDGTLELITRRGKQRVVPEDDPLLRRPSWIERLVWRHKFPPDLSKYPERALGRSRA
jgi:hypothetical protein